MEIKLIWKDLYRQKDYNIVINFNQDEIDNLVSYLKKDSSDVRTAYNINEIKETLEDIIQNFKRKTPFS